MASEPSPDHSMTNASNNAGDEPRRQIAFLGIGSMGHPMARRLCEAGHHPQVWNRTPAKADALAELGATAHRSASAAVLGADIVISMLENGSVVEDVLFGQGVASAMKPGALFIDMASIKPREARDHAARLGALGIAHLDAPVSGGTGGADEGTLVMMAGGKAADFKLALPLLQIFGRATHVGSHGAGQLTKLANQMIVGITIGAVAEALLFAAKGGADMAKVKEAITGGFADSRILQTHGQRMVNRDFVTQARFGLQHKDMHNALLTAQEIGFEAPITELFEQLYADGMKHGLTDLDHSGLFVELASRNGMS
jgi:3-hydroxyisobutyrate dehydrogenase-like beta-hydroxyacid dehydrogenase